VTAIAIGWTLQIGRSSIISSLPFPLLLTVSSGDIDHCSILQGINQQGAKAGDFFSNADRLVPNYILCFPWPKGFSTLDLSHWTILVGPWRRCDLEWKEGSIEPKDDSVAVLRTVL
jgi:hypothetical protein